MWISGFHDFHVGIEFEPVRIFMWSIFFIALGVALGCSFFCSLCEAALLSLTPGQIEGMAQKCPRKAQVWRAYRSSVDTPISAILILNTSAHTIGATIAGSQVAELCKNDSLWLTVFSIGFTYLMLQFTEILPKNLGVRFNTTVANFVTVPLGIMIFVFRPIIWFVHFMNRPFETKDAPTVSPLEELSALVKMGKKTDLFDTIQGNIVENGVVMQSRTAGEVMVPVGQMVFLSLDQTPGEALEMAKTDPHTRFPLREHADSNRVLGYLNLKDLFSLSRFEQTTRMLNTLKRGVRFAAPETTLSELMKYFVRERGHMIIVQDKQKHTLGMITVEDILEELLGGDLQDEFDTQLPTHALRSGYDIFTFGGGVAMTAVGENLTLDFSLTEKTKTLSDWLLERFKDVPAPNEKIQEDGWVFVVRRVRRDRIFDVLVMKGNGTQKEVDAEKTLLFDGPAES